MRNLYNSPFILTVLMVICGVTLRIFKPWNDIVAYIIILAAIMIDVFWFLGKKKLKKAQITLTALLIAGVVAFTAVEIPIISDSRTDDNPKAEYVIVLGAGVDGTVPSVTLVNRLNAALDYLNTYKDAKAIVSGGQGPRENVTEAFAMKRWLVSKGIDENRIIEENKATSTLENIKFSSEKIVQDSGNTPQTVAIVSSEYHLYRAKKIASNLGMDAKGVAGKTTMPVMKINYFIREGLAAVYIWAFGIR